MYEDLISSLCNADGATKYGSVCTGRDLFTITDLERFYEREGGGVFSGASLNQEREGGTCLK